MDLSCDITTPRTILNPETPEFRPRRRAASAAREHIRIIAEEEEEEEQ